MMETDAISTSALLGHTESDTFPGTKNYFKKLEIRFKASLLIVFLVPMALLSLYFHFQFTYSLKQSARLNLAAISESQRNTVDLFLQERVVNIFTQFQSEDFNLKPTNQTMESYLHNLRQVSDAFIDVGFLNSQGIQTGYAGPFPYLQNQNYANENWFATLMQEDRNHFISDIYLGFRKKPHSVISINYIEKTSAVHHPVFIIKYDIFFCYIQYCLFGIVKTFLQFPVGESQVHPIRYSCL